MTLRLTLLVACAALGGCSTLAQPDLPDCSGASRRPANPHGSILSPTERATADPVSTTASPPPPSGGCA